MLVINRELAVAFQVIRSESRREFSSWNASQPQSPVLPRAAIGHHAHRSLLPDADHGTDQDYQLKPVGLHAEHASQPSSAAEATAQPAPG